VAGVGLLREPFELVRGHDVMLLRACFVVALDVREPVEVIGVSPMSGSSRSGTCPSSSDA
jgi:hypothetical protein